MGSARGGAALAAPPYRGKISPPELSRKRLLLALPCRVRLLGLEQATNLVTQLRRVLVAVHRGRVLGGRANHLVLLTDDGAAAVGLAWKTTTIGHHASHQHSSFRG